MPSIPKFLKTSSRLFLLIFFVTGLSFANNDEQPSNSSIFDLGRLQFSSVGNNVTIPYGIVSALTQDNQGFIWIGTQDGLVRYDGYSYRLYAHNKNNPSSIAGNYVRSLWSAVDGTVWAGTVSDGLSVYVPQQDAFKHFQHNADDPASLSDSYVRTIVGDKYGNVFIGTSNGLDHIAVETGKITRLSSINGCETTVENNVIQSIALTDSQQLWVGSTNGLCKVNLVNDNDQRFNPDLALSGRELSKLNGQNVYRLFLAEDKKLWVGTRHDGAFIVNDDGESITHIPYMPDNQQTLGYRWVFAIAQPTVDEIWIGTTGGGISVADAKSGKIIRQQRHEPSDPSSISSDEIGALLTDNAGLLWIGTWGGGLNLYNPHNTAFRTLRHIPNDASSLSHADITALLQVDDQHIWIGSSVTGIDIVDINQGVIGGFRPNSDDPNALTDGYIRSMYRSSDGTVWIGTNSNGLHYYDAKSQRVVQVPNSGLIPDLQIRSFIETANQKLWVGTNNGLALLNLASKKFESLKDIANISAFNGKAINSMVYFDDSEQLWIGSQAGLSVLSIPDNSLSNFSEQAGNAKNLADNSIRSLYLDENQQLFIGTPLGLDRLVSFDGKTAIFESVDSLVERPPRYSGNLMGDDQQRVWDLEGWVDPITKTWRDLGSADGFDVGTIWEGSYAKSNDGTLLFGGSKGVLMVRPDRWKAWTHQPRVVISELEINNQLVPATETVELTPSMRSFSVEVAALDYTDPEKNIYAYMLVGFDHDWIETDASKRRITYTNLPPGNYQLRVRATNRNGLWSPHQINLSVTQLPAWYETIWFRLLIITSLAALLYLLFQWRIRHLESQKVALDELVHQRTKELAEKSKELAKKNKQLELAIVTDHLTGIHNRNFFSTFIDNEVKQLRRLYARSSASENSKIGIILVDVDYFKQINDQFGHNAGDKALVQITEVLKSTCRENDWIIRWGGEEFLIVCRSRNIEELQVFVERLRTAIKSTEFKISEEKSITSTCSFGVCTFPFNSNDFDAFSVEETIQIADNALYMAKNKSRNTWVSFENLAEDTDDESKQTILANSEKAAEQGLVKITIPNNG